VQEFEVQRSALIAEIKSKDDIVRQWQAEEASIQNVGYKLIDL
jgi:hypothetical protein